MISVSNLSLSIGERHILQDLNFEIPTGISVAFVGASGSGKTSLLNLLSLILQPTSGTIVIDGKDVTRISSRRRELFWRKKAAFVLQDYGLIDSETAGYNVMLSSPPLIKRKAIEDPGALAALASVGLDKRAGSTVATLSGGEKQRIGIARALYKEAEYVFADEPTASLDSDNSANVTRLLLGNGAPHRTTVISTHDLRLAEQCDVQIRL